MNSISQTYPKSNFDSRPLRFRVEAQGGLFCVALDSDLKKSTTKSCAADVKIQRKHSARIWQNYQRDFSFEDAFEALACTGSPADTSVEQDPVYMAVITDEARETIAREACHATLRELHGQAPRKQIAEFSRKSRLRLLKTVSRLEKSASGLFLTFTYRANMQDHTEAKRHLDLLLRWLKYNYPAGAFLWRMEYQQRGAIHFHIIAFNIASVNIADVTSYWQQMTGDDSYPDVERIQNRRKALSYVSKYVAKRESNSVSGFISEPYSEKTVFFGRFWGIVNRKLLPFAPRVYHYLKGDAKVFHDLRRYARRHYKNLSRRYQGFTLMVDNAERWLDLMWHIESTTDHILGLRL